MKYPLLIVTLAVLTAASVSFTTQVAAQAAQAPSSSAPAASSPAKDSSIPPDQENAHKARELLEQAIQALGGQAYLNVHEMQEQGRVYSFYHGRPTSNGVFSNFPIRNGSSSPRSGTSPTSTAAIKVTKSPTRGRARWRKRISKTISGVTNSLWKRSCVPG